MEKFIESLNWRYATKKFDTDKKVSESDVNDLIESLRLAPSSFGLQPWKFIIVTDRKIREQLKEHAYNQAQITDASHLIVLCVRTDVDEAHVDKFVESIAKTRGVSKESLNDYAQIMTGSVKSRSEHHVTEWSRRQVYIALGFLIFAASMKRIDSCPMEGFDSAKFDEILGLKKENLSSVVLCPVGYRSKDDGYAQAKKVRFSKNDVIGFR